MTEHRSADDDGSRDDSTGLTRWIARLPAIVEQSREPIAHVTFQNRRRNVPDCRGSITRRRVTDDAIG